jgi:N-(2-amino-2-carboxyethyl)-L-glutamate synthase
VLAAVVELAPEFAPGDTVVAISADLGDKYLDTIYDRAWVEHVITPRGREAKHARPVAAE